MGLAFLPLRRANRLRLTSFYRLREIKSKYGLTHKVGRDDKANHEWVAIGLRNGPSLLQTGLPIPGQWLCYQIKLIFHNMRGRAIQGNFDCVPVKGRQLFLRMSRGMTCQ